MNPRPDGRKPWLLSQLEDALARVKLASVDECVEWRGTMNTTGYGQAWLNGRKYKAHRLIYEIIVGPIANGLVLDHLCRNIVCVNPAHLDPVTNRENMLRGVGPFKEKAIATHCMRGHEFTPENTRLRPGKYGRRRGCKECARTQARERKARMAESKEAS